MDDPTWLAERFEEQRTRLRAVAYRMLGSASEADDAVQDAWLRISRTDTAGQPRPATGDRRLEVPVPGAGPTPEPVVLRGARQVARGATAAGERARFSQLALVNGAVGVVMAPRGKLFVVLAFTLVDDLITEIDVIGDPERLRSLELAVLTA